MGNLHVRDTMMSTHGTRQEPHDTKDNFDSIDDRVDDGIYVCMSQRAGTQMTSMKIECGNAQVK